MTDDERAALGAAGYRVGDADDFVREVLSGDEPSDMPPWIVDDWDVNPHFGVTIWSDGTMGIGRKWNTVPPITRDEAIAMCRRILAILEGEPT